MHTAGGICATLHLLFINAKMDKKKNRKYVMSTEIRKLLKSVLVRCSDVVFVF